MEEAASLPLSPAPDVCTAVCIPVPGTRPNLGSRQGSGSTQGFYQCALAGEVQTGAQGSVPTKPLGSPMHLSPSSAPAGRGAWGPAPLQSVPRTPYYPTTRCREGGASSLPPAPPSPEEQGVEAIMNLSPKAGSQLSGLRRAPPALASPGPRFCPGRTDPDSCGATKKRGPKGALTLSLTPGTTVHACKPSSSQGTPGRLGGHGETRARSSPKPKSLFQSFILACVSPLLFFPFCHRQVLGEGKRDKDEEE